MDFDQIDRRLIELLSQDGRKSVSILAELVGVSRITVRRRIDALEAGNVIAGYTIRHGAGYERSRFRAQILLKLRTNVGEELIAFFASLAAVTNISTISGHYDASIMIEADRSEQIDAILDQIRRHSAVEETESMLHLATKLDRAVL
ncbi:MAG: Lrp/AsnC family transcriptional regulator [Cohaesibacter sp.]|nr:Lrp/AsnC family transcriptional regulator [Cohaesibacter sp.]